MQADRVAHSLAAHRRGQDAERLTQRRVVRGLDRLAAEHRIDDGLVIAVQRLDDLAAVSGFSHSRVMSSAGASTIFRASQLWRYIAASSSRSMMSSRRNLLCARLSRDVIMPATRLDSASPVRTRALRGRNAVFNFSNIRQFHALQSETFASMSVVASTNGSTWSSCACVSSAVNAFSSFVKSSTHGASAGISTRPAAQ